VEEGFAMQSGLKAAVVFTALKRIWMRNGSKERRKAGVQSGEEKSAFFFLAQGLEAELLISVRGLEPEGGTPARQFSLRHLAKT